MNIKFSDPIDIQYLGWIYRKIFYTKPKLKEQ